MASRRNPKSHVTAWVLVVGAVPVSYVLTLPFLGQLTVRFGVDDSPWCLRAIKET